MYVIPYKISTHARYLPVQRSAFLGLNGQSEHSSPDVGPVHVSSLAQWAMRDADPVRVLHIIPLLGFFPFSCSQ